MPTLLSIHQLASHCPYAFVNPKNLTCDTELMGVGGDLATTTLAYAYLHGFFPWFNHDEAIAWWSPNPRCVLDPCDFFPKKSLQRTAKQSLTLSLNHAFEQVIHACSLPRAYTQDTWIHDTMKNAYQQLHQLGLAHSLEVWDKGELVGGLYGVKIGACFFGESMFHNRRDMSKIAFWALTQLCQKTNVAMIDCQLVNPHLLSLGAGAISRHDYLNALHRLTCLGGVGEHSHDWQSLTWQLSSQDLTTPSRPTADK